MVVNLIQKLATVFGIALRHESGQPFSSALALPHAPIPCQLRVTPQPEPVISAPTFTRERYYLSPARIFRFLYGVSTSIPGQLEIYRLMKLPAYAAFLRVDPRFRFKFLIRDYLVRGFSPAERTACFLQHYKRLHACMSADLLRCTLYRSVTVFCAKRDGLDLEVGLCFSRPFEKEGELSLNLHVNGAVVFVLSFTMVPGWVVKSEAEDVLLVTRLQGTNGFYPQIRAATKTMHDVGPAALLLAALHGFAKALGIEAMAGVCAARQSSYTEEMSTFYESAYDKFFSEIGIPKSAGGFFLGPLPPEDRPMSTIKHGHKIRTREKREFKRLVAEDVYRLLQQGMIARNSGA